MKILRGIMVRAMRFFWNLVSMLFIGVAVLLTWCWRAAWYLMNFTQDMAAVTGKRADHWDDKLQKKRGT